jgi:dynein heavy chain 1, cytosolic
MEVLSPIPPNGLSSPDPSPSTDPLVVLEHLSEVLQITLGAARRELEAVGCLLSKAKETDSINRCARFASESQVALYAQKTIVEEEHLNGTASDSGEAPWFFLTKPC